MQMFKKEQACHKIISQFFSRLQLLQPRGRRSAKDDSLSGIKIVLKAEIF